jgi:AraC-like DNA-binding protein/CheY-like chemotaxis protein
VLDTPQERRIPSLVDRYLANDSTPEGSVAHFMTCVRDLLRYRCISNSAVQQAVAIIGARYADSSCDPRTIAETVGVRLSTLDAAFKRQMACTSTEYIRRVRLERSAILLVTTNKTIKEVWAEIGYNHPSNFDHDFKRRFGRSPRELRAGSIRSTAQSHYEATTPAGDEDDDRPIYPTSVLIVDDDECTRWTLSTYLSGKGFTVSAAATGYEGLRSAKDASPDVILVDYRLGDMDGLEFLRLLHPRIGDPVPALALFTADWDLFEQADDVNTLGATIVSKLCDLHQLQRVIVSLSRRKKRRRTPSRTEGIQ